MDRKAHYGVLSGPFMRSGTGSVESSKGRPMSVKILPQRAGRHLSSSRGNR